MHGQKVLVTGGAGFIGSHLVDTLVAAGAEVRVFDNLASGKLGNLAESRDGIDLVNGDVRDLEACRKACRDREVVFHLAAVSSVPLSMEDPATSMSVNLLGSTHVFVAAREAGARRVVYASSSSVYGDDELLPKREGQEGRLLSPYAASKWMTEELATLFRDCHGQDLIGMRYFNVFGPRQDPAGAYAAAIPRFFQACLANQGPTIFGDGSQSRDFASVGVAVRATLLAASAGERAAGGAFNVAGGRRTTITELATQIGALTRCPHPPAYAEPRPGDVLHSYADGSLSAELLGYEPSVGLEEGLELTLGYYRELFGPADDGEADDR